MISQHTGLQTFMDLAAGVNAAHTAEAWSIAVSLDDDSLI